MTEKTQKFQLSRENTVLVVVDVQERLVPSMPQPIYRRTERTIDFLVATSRLLGIPMVATEQYPRGLGHTVSELAAAGQEKTIEKMTFGCCGEASFVEHLAGLERSQVLLVGMEAHVCVYQTLLGLLEGGSRVHLVRDGIISRGKVDYLNALELSRAAGAIVTTAETAAFQLLKTAAAAEFKAVSALVKERFAGAAQGG